MSISWMNIRFDHDNNFLWNLQWLGFWGFLSESLMRIKSRESVMERHRFGKSGRDGRQAQWGATKSCAVVLSCKSCARSNKLRRSCDDLQKILQNAVVCRFMRATERDWCAINLHRWKLVAFIFYTTASIDSHMVVLSTMLILISTESVFYQLHRRLSSWTAFGFHRNCFECKHTRSGDINERTVSENGNFMIRPNNTRLSLEVRCTLSFRLKSKFNSPDMQKGNIFG